jgi:hypothetical protein
MSIRKVAAGSTFTFKFGTRQFSSGAPFTLAGSPSISLYPTGSATQITAGITLTVDYDSKTGYNDVSVVGATAGLADGTHYTAVVEAGTVDGVSVVGAKVYEFQTETVAERALREFQARMFPGNEVATTTGNTTGAINLAEVVPSSAEASDVIGEILAVGYEGGTFDGLVLLARVTAYAVTNQLATVQQLDGNALPEAVAAGDWVWRISQDGTTRNGSPLAITGDEMDLRDTPNATALEALADAVLDEALSGHATAGTLGKAVADIETDATAILLDTDTTIPDLIAALENLSAAQVNAQVLDVLATDTFAELSATPGATPTLATILMWLYMKARNELDNDGSIQQVKQDDGTVISEAAVSVSGGTATRAKYANP